MRVLLTGGAGYIGSHTAVELLQSGIEVVIADDLSNSSLNAVKRVEAITGKSVVFYLADVSDTAMLRTVFRENRIDAVIHFAGFKAVGESVAKPLKYYRNNLCTTLSLLEVMNENGCGKIVFSSSATVYGDPDTVPLSEDSPVKSGTNPYARTKRMIEQILTDFNAADKGTEVTILRYFNPVGAHPSGMIGENPNGVPNNLMPYITQVAVGKLPKLSIFGSDYPTPDGTCIRDYVHVVDLAKGHMAALNHSAPGVNIYNLGTGKGYSVLEVVDAFERVNGVKIPRVMAPRRAGDVAVCYSSSEKAAAVLGWHAELSMDDMVRDAWNWQIKNPDGYAAE